MTWAIATLLQIIQNWLEFNYTKLIDFQKVAKTAPNAQIHPEMVSKLNPQDARGLIHQKKRDNK